jgi:hypothetical protein
MIIENSDIIKLIKQLFPTGIAFRLTFSSVFKKIMYSLGISHQIVATRALSIFDKLLMDNNNLVDADLTLWEQRLGLVVSPIGLSIDQRKSLILQAYIFPGTQIYRQNWRFIQWEIQQAGFTNLFVFENTIPIDVYNNNNFNLNSHRLGQYRLNQQGIQYELVANSSNPSEIFDLGNSNNSKSCFFICGSTFGTFSTVPTFLHVILRQLILKLKPANTVAVLMINWIDLWILTTGYWNDAAYWIDTDFWID